VFRRAVCPGRLPVGASRGRLPHDLGGRYLPECGTCGQCPLTVKHILVECVDLKDVRNKHFVASNIKDLFDNIIILKHIKTRLYKQL